ncbi:uncharacterized protein LY89DRAFT_691935 [Mollisia scopiformis]|uniref:Uncharacterized protein n=1 Tax=Mollisia scopiformis TaxID=149040 RepID=A0A132B4H3_MOLSC|nr:uncharacterized protein LY89DRAFT_691935 [Mollisia scopiformis]KUJ07133.1 hypothetical protein LY89DRAFT_691935 [Mollisia scopiformis]
MNRRCFFRSKGPDTDDHSPKFTTPCYEFTTVLPHSLVSKPSAYYWTPRPGPETPKKRPVIRPTWGIYS